LLTFFYTLRQPYFAKLLSRVLTKSQCFRTLMRVEITVVSVVITFVHIKIRIRVKNTVCLYKSHLYHIQTHTCQQYFLVSRNHALRIKSHSACGSRTLRVEINLVHVEITLVRVRITFLRVKTTLVSVKITMRVENTVYLDKSHS
jgi:hypothetical protein